MLSLYQMSELTPIYTLSFSKGETKGVLSVIYSSKINEAVLGFYHDCHVESNGDEVKIIHDVDINDNTSYYSKNVVGISGDTNGIMTINDDSFSEEKKKHLYHVFGDLFNFDEKNMNIVYLESKHIRT